MINQKHFLIVLLGSLKVWSTNTFDIEQSEKSRNISERNLKVFFYVKFRPHVKLRNDKFRPKNIENQIGSSMQKNEFCLFFELFRSLGNNFSSSRSSPTCLIEVEKWCSFGLTRTKFRSTLTNKTPKANVVLQTRLEENFRILVALILDSIRYIFRVSSSGYNQSPEIDFHRKNCSWKLISRIDRSFFSSTEISRRFGAKRSKCHEFWDIKLYVRQIFLNAETLHFLRRSVFVAGRNIHVDFGS